MNIRTYLGKQILGVLASYQGEKISTYICVVYPGWDNQLKVFFPKGHQLAVGEFATVHLDNRTGVDAYDENLSVYRASYKGEVVSAEEDWIVLAPRECMMFHGVGAVVDIRQAGYRYPADPRPPTALLPTTLQHLPALNANDQVNKVGVLVTLAPEQPHTTVLAFLSTDDDDIFFITLPETFKSKVLKKDSRCIFVVDERANFIFDRHVEWNYKIIAGNAFEVPRGSALFEEVRTAFIRKNSWEIAFFTREDLEMVHIRRSRALCPGSSTVLS